MVKDLYENNVVVKSVIDEVSDVLNMDLKNFMFNGNEEEFFKIENI